MASKGKITAMQESTNASKPSIVVAGDVCIDVVGVPIPRHGATDDGTEENWRLTGEIRTHYLRGGALLLADMVRAAAPAARLNGPRLETPEALRRGKTSTRLDGTLFERLTRDEIVHSVLRAGAFHTSAKADKNDKTLRVAQTHGFSGPVTGNPKLTPKVLPSARPDILVLDDTGNRFRRDASQWGRLLAKSPRLIVHKLHRPLPLASHDGNTSGNLLWNELAKNHRDRSVVVVSADDLRAAGAVASRQLSWERTARETLWNLAGSAEFAPLAKCRWLVIRFGLDGALCWHHPKSAEASSGRAWLIYDPNGIENHFATAIDGEMVGYGSAFTAALTAALRYTRALPDDAANIPSALASGIKRGLHAARRLLKVGFGKVDSKRDPLPAYPVAEIFNEAGAAKTAFGCIAVPLPSQNAVADPTGAWTILKSLFPGGDALRQTAVDLAFHKKPPTSLGLVPLGEFGKLKTYDRTEIESYRAISNLMREYLAVSAPKRPLCFAVFGPPGSGKSFGVEQVAETVAGDAFKLKKLVFNLSQFRGPEELAPAFHLVRDAVLKGSVPLVFFDEFDSSVGSTRLFWLKYLLAPMQDGEFLEQGVVHPIGKAIFVFAGGTCDNYEKFMRPDAVKSDTAPDNTNASADFFRAAKGKDFVSRLRGYLNISGIDHGDDYRGPALLRRAGILRFQLSEKATQLFDPEGSLRIDPGVLRAFLEIRKYDHGVRSLEALLDMSMLAGRERFEPGCLPSPGQLSLHAPPMQTDQPGYGFLELVHAESPWPGEVRDRIARAIHEHYLAERELKGELNPKKESHQPWNHPLNDFYKDSNRTQADDIPRKLRLLGLDYLPRHENKDATPLTEDDLAREQFTAQVDHAACAEHERWCAERRRQGWIYGVKEDTSARIHPDLKDWAKLDSKTKEKDLAAIRAIPRFLKAAGYVVIDRSDPTSRAKSLAAKPK